MPWVTTVLKCEADIKAKRADLAIENLECMQDGNVTLGGTLYGRVYSPPPVPRAASLGDSTFLEPSAASFDHSTGVYLRCGWQ